jgi:hypothetical protein
MRSAPGARNLVEGRLCRTIFEPASENTRKKKNAWGYKLQAEIGREK